MAVLQSVYWSLILLAVGQIVSLTTQRISVVMPVHNALPYLDESIESILNQTHSDFEFVIRDDASNDGSTEVLRDWAKRDSRIVLHEGREQLGPARSSNNVVEQAGCPVIARMDADDISRPDRLRRQLEVLTDRTDTVLVGTLWEGIDPMGRIVRPRDRWSLAQSSCLAPFAHGSIMYRREVFQQVGGYRPECDYWEDLELYLRMRRHGKVLILPDPLYLHRFSENSTRLSSKETQVAHATDTMYKCMVEFGRGKDYEKVLEQSRRCHGQLVSPRALISVTATRLWSGRRPRVLTRLIRESRLGLDAASAYALLWAAVGEASPRFLRFMLRWLMRGRDYSVRSRFPDGQPREWQCGGRRRVRRAAPPDARCYEV